MLRHCNRNYLAKLFESRFVPFYSAEEGYPSPAI